MLSRAHLFSFFRSSSSSSLSATPLLFASQRFSSAAATSAAPKKSTTTTTATVIEQQSEQAEYDEILAAASRQQLQASSSNVIPPGHTAKLLFHAHPKIFAELATVDASPERRRHCEKHLFIDSPEIFRWNCGDCGKQYAKSVVERALFDSKCPHCTAASRPKLLSEVRPELVAEVAGELHNDPFLDVQNLASDSKSKIWWTCKACGCDFQARVTDRVRGRKECPRCNVQQSEYVAEKLRKEWHPTKNGDLDPNTVLLLSEKKQVVWWLCSTCTHEWPARVSARFGGSGSCAKCFAGTSALASSSASSATSPVFTKSQTQSLRNKLKRQRDTADEQSRLASHKRNTAAHEKMNAVLKKAVLMQEDGEDSSSSSSRPSSRLVVKDARINNEQKKKFEAQLREKMEKKLKEPTPVRNDEEEEEEMMEEKKSTKSTRVDKKKNSINGLHKLENQFLHANGAHKVGRPTKRH